MSFLNFRRIACALAAFGFGSVCSIGWAQAVATIPYGISSYLPPNSEALFSNTGAPQPPGTFPIYFFYGPVMVTDVYHGRFTGQDGLTLADLDAAWVENAFTRQPGDGKRVYSVTVTSGPYEGLKAEIVTSSSSALVVDRLPASADLVGTTYVVRSAFQSTVISLLGDAGMSAFYTQGHRTDTVGYGFWDGIRFTEVLYQGFRLVIDRTDPTLNRSGLVIRTDRGMYFRFDDAGLGSGSTYGPPGLFGNTGSVQTGRLGIWIDPGSNFINPVAILPFTLGTSNLYTGDPTTGLKAGSPTTADIVSIHNGTAFEDYYMRQTAAGVVGWRKAGDVGTDCSGVTLPAGRSFMIRRRPELPTFVWYRPSLFPSQPDNLPEGTPLPQSASDADAMNYDAWAALTIGSGDRSPSADNDGDGRPNLLEYFLGTNPLLRDDPVYGVTVGQASGRYGYGRYFKLSAHVPRDVKDVAYRIESSSDLEHWSEVPLTMITQAQGMNVLTGYDWNEGGSSGSTSGYLFPSWGARRYIRLVVRLNTPSATLAVPESQ